MIPEFRMPRLIVFALICACLCSACATLDPDYETPTVTLSSLKALPSEGMIPAFEIGLRIINPNASDLDVQGIVYTVALQGYELVKGVGKDFPVIEGYSEGMVTLTASANLLAGIRMVTELMNQPGEKLEYEFKAKLDLGGFQPSIRIAEKGDLDLGGQSRNPR
jgi:LEA14-like dessication related protein